jgi:hypothetical protein
LSHSKFAHVPDIPYTSGHQPFRNLHKQAEKASQARSKANDTRRMKFFSIPLSQKAVDIQFA